MQTGQRHIPISDNTRPFGFTLVELLVVIALISLLLAIVLPVLGKARSLAKRSVCQSNLRQLSLAWSIYLDDYNGEFYQGVNTNLNYGGWVGAMVHWPERPLNTYLALPATIAAEKDAQIFACPADSGGVPGYGQYLSSHFCLGTSYQTNLLLIGPARMGIPSDARGNLFSQINIRLPGLKRSSISQPSRLLLIGDYGWVNQWDIDMPVVTEWHNRKEYHNLAFLDGHVEFLHIYKGIFVAPGYRVLPFNELDPLACKLQPKTP